MKKIQVFLSSAMTGELSTERAVLRARFGPGTPLSNQFELYLFEDNASPDQAEAAYTQEVQRSPIVIFLFAETLRAAVVAEFEAATRGSAIFCYLRGGAKRSAELDSFIRDRVREEVQYAQFSSSEDLFERVESDIQRWIAQLIDGNRSAVRPMSGELLQIAALDQSTAQRFCDAALTDTEAARISGDVPVDLSAHSLWGTVRPQSLLGLSFDRQEEIEEFNRQIDGLKLNGAVFPTLNTFASRGLRFTVRVLLLHPDSDQAAVVDRSQRVSSDANEKARFALSDIYLTLYVLKRLARKHGELGLSTVRVMSSQDSMAFSLTRIGGHALVVPYPRDQLLEGAASYSVRGTPGDLTPFGRRLAEFEQLWRQVETPGRGYEIALDALPSPFQDLRQRVDTLIKRDRGWESVSSRTRGRASDPTPFGTRTKLLTRYSKQVQAFWNGDDPYPVALEVNPVNYCDQGCHWCISENVHHRGWSIDFDHPHFAPFIEDFHRHGGEALGWSGGGEPTTHPALVRGMQIVSSAGISQGLITHGAFSPNLVDPIARHCEWIRISIDTNNRDDYARKRFRTTASGVKAFDRVVDNVKALVAAQAHVGLNVNVARWNQPQVEDIYEWAAALGVAYLQVRPTLMTPFPHVQSEDLLSVEDVSALLHQLRTLEQKVAGLKTRLVISHDKFSDIVKPDFGRSYVGCVAHRLFVVLNANGDLAVCMYQMADRRFIFGNIYKHSLESIWLSDQRKQVLRFCTNELSHAMHECQVCCKGHEINKVLDGVRGGVLADQIATSTFI